MSQPPYLCALGEARGEQRASWDDPKDVWKSWGWVAGAGRDYCLAEVCRCVVGAQMAFTEEAFTSFDFGIRFPSTRDKPLLRELGNLLWTLGPAAAQTEQRAAVPWQPAQL